MANYIYGAMTFGALIQAYVIVDTNVPNNLWYWIDSVIPF